MATYQTNTASALDEVTLGYQLIGMELVDFEIRSKRAIEDSLINFKIEINHIISEDGKVHVNAKSSILYNDESLSSTNIVCTFLIENYKEWLDLQGLTNGVLPTGLANIINGITISTLRGVMFVKLQGTFLASIMLPVVDVQVFQHQ